MERTFSFAGRAHCPVNITGRPSDPSTAGVSVSTWAHVMRSATQPARSFLGDLVSQYTDVFDLDFHHVACFHR